MRSARVARSPLGAKREPQDPVELSSAHAAAQWQAAGDLPTRRRMVQRIAALVQQQHASPTGVLLAKRLELALYSRAASAAEYAASATLRRRLQALVGASVHEAAAAKEQRAAKRSLDSMATTNSMNKRQRVAQPARAAAASGAVLSLGEDCTRAVFGFLDGKDVLRLRELNRGAAALLPSCVLSIRLEAQQLAAGLALGPAAGLAALVNLEQLVVARRGAFRMAPANVMAPLLPPSLHAPLHAWGCAELATTQRNDGEAAVVALATALQGGALPALRSLQLVAVFANTRTRDGVGALCAALARCPKLEDLLLGGNHLGDHGAQQVARLVQSGALPRLARLDLRRNYIGESGLLQLLDAFGRAKAPLEVLCLGGNLLTDHSVAAVERRGLFRATRLAFLGLEDNFLSAQGVERVLAAARAHGAAPRLQQLQ